MNTFPESGNGVYAVLTCTQVSVLCCLTEIIGGWTVTDSRRYFLLQMLYLSCAPRTKLVPYMALHWLPALETSAKLQEHQEILVL